MEVVFGPHLMIATCDYVYRPWIKAVNRLWIVTETKREKFLVLLYNCKYTSEINLFYNQFPHYAHNAQEEKKTILWSLTAFCSIIYFHT